MTLFKKKSNQLQSYEAMLRRRNAAANNVYKIIQKQNVDRSSYLASCSSNHSAIRPIIASLFSSAVVLGCASQGSTWVVPNNAPIQGSELGDKDIIYSRQVGISPYKMGGIVVKGSGNWYLGKTKGMKVDLVPGGIRYSLPNSSMTKVKDVSKPTKAKTVKTLSTTISSTHRPKETALSDTNAAVQLSNVENQKHQYDEITDPAWTVSWDSQTIRCIEYESQKYISTASIKNLHESKTDIYTVEPGNALWRIAKTNYGLPALWPVIYEANIETIGGNPNLIYPGQKIVIEAKPSAKQAKSAAKRLCKNWENA